MIFFDRISLTLIGSVGHLLKFQNVISGQVIAVDDVFWLIRF